MNSEKTPFKGYEVPVRDLLVGISGLAVLLLIFITLLPDSSFIRPFIAVLFLSLIPGMLLLQLLGVKPTSFVTYLLYAFGVSAILVMAIGAGMSLILPELGIERPLSTEWVLLFSLLLVGALSSEVYRQKGLESHIVQLPSLDISLSAIFTLYIPFLGLIAITLLNQFGFHLPMIILLCLIALVPFFTLLNKDPRVVLPLLLWTVALTLLYYQSLWGKSYPLEMWIHGMILEMGQWTPAIGSTSADIPEIRGMGYESILPSAVLYPIYILIAGIDPMTQLRVVNPLFISLIPLALYEMFRQYVSRRDAFLSTLIFVFSFRFYVQHFPNGPRDVIALLFLALFGLALADSELTARNQRILILMFIIGIAVSHYGASYIFLAALVISIIVLKAISLIDQYTTLSINQRHPFADAIDRRLLPLITLFALIVVISWYAFTAHGTKLQPLIESIYRFVTDGISPSGLHSDRVLSPKPFSIELARIFYIAIVGLCGVGLISETYRRVINIQPRIRGEHLLISYGLFLLFGMSFLSVGTGYGPGRVYMISLSFLAVFMVLALYDIQNALFRISQEYPILGMLTEVISPTNSHTKIRSLLAVFLCVFLLLNTGVVAETITQGDDYGPNMIINNERLAQSQDPETRLVSQGCIDCDIGSYVWLLRYGPNGDQLYTDSTSNSYFWYGASIVDRVDNFVNEYLLANHSLLYRQDLPTRSLEAQPEGYIFLSHENHASGYIYPVNEEPQPINDDELGLDQTDKVHASGSTTIYRIQESSKSTTHISDEDIS